VVDQPDAALASAIVWFDAFVSNVDRTPRNTNLLVWHRKLWLIDHGAALYFHHAWDGYLARASDPFTRIRDHVLLPYATQLREADERLATLLSRETIERIVAAIPDAWLGGDAPFASASEQREAYASYLCRRIEAPRAFVEEALRARV
jgi:hypothetical protein